MPTATGRFLLFSLVVALLAGSLFLPGLPGEFVFDDLPNIVNNTSIQLTQLNLDALLKLALTPQISGSTRGLPTLTFALDYWRAGGADPATFKLTNIAIHALTTFALACFFRRLLQVAGSPAHVVRWAAPALALAWGAHPMHVSAVLYVVQRLQTLGTLFLVLALWAYLGARQAQIEHRSGRTGLMIAGLLWVLAMSCKEDSTLLPAYTLALELTVLRFAAADTTLAHRLRRGYLLATIAAAALYLLVVVPHYWYWDTLPGRDFSTTERLLTQARVLCMYLWQILLPLPSHMPFYYDWVQPSHGLLRPWTTLPSLLLVFALLGTAWRIRHAWPLVALGVFWFFSAHFIASNVIGLELAFEHRNHFALVGAVLAVGSLLAHASQRLHVPRIAQSAICAVLLGGLATATVVRANTWGSLLEMARMATVYAPGSARAWIQVCASHFEAGGGAVAGNPRLDPAIAACSAGSKAVPASLNNTALLIVLKTLRGTVTPQDWTLFQHRLDTVRMTRDNTRATLILRHFAHEGVKLDKTRLLRALDTLVRRAELTPFDLTSIGYFVMNDLAEPDLSIPYFMRAIAASHPRDPFPQQLAGELRAKGRPDLAAKIEQVGAARPQVMGH